MFSKTPQIPDTAVFPGQRLHCLALLSWLLPCSTENIMPPSPGSVVLIQTIYRHREQSFAFIQTPKQGYYISPSSSVCSDLKMVCRSIHVMEANSVFNGFTLCLCLFTDPCDGKRQRDCVMRKKIIVKHFLDSTACTQ